VAEALEPLLRAGPTLALGAVVAVVLGGAGFSPLLAGPGYEAALVAGLIVPAAAAVATALEVRAAAPTPLAALGRGVANGSAFAAVAYALAWLHGLRTGFCDLTGGTLSFLLGPVVGAWLAGVWGALAGELGRRAGAWRGALAVGLALSAPLGSIAVSLGRFYTSPIIFAYDPFVGFFSGSLYDTVIDSRGLWTYRAASVATLFACFVAAAHVERRERGGLRLRRVRHPGLLALGVVAATASALVALNGPKLGHWQTSRSIEAALGAVTQGKRCRVVYARSLRSDEVERFARECDAHVASGERWLDVAGPQTITAYLFADTAQKQALMGAAHTFIAKPWRREIYVQVAGYPHPVLGHELAHVLAGSVARGPFKVAGSLGGLLPNPGLIEGLAVAASPTDSELSPREWAKAMKDLELLPPLERLFALGFLGENSSTAYTASGAFVGWVRDQAGAKVLGAWYGGADLPELMGRSWGELERAWHEDLDRVELSDVARAAARARFDRPAIFGRRCPHVVDECKERAAGLRDEGDDEGAIVEARRVLALDPGDALAALGLAASQVRLGRLDEGRASLLALANDERLTPRARDRALEDLGDLALSMGQLTEAAARYTEVAARSLSEDALRTLDVKLRATRDEVGRAAIVALLVGSPDRGPDKPRAMELLGAWSAEAPDDGLPDYLLARHYVSAGQLVEAAAHLDRASTRSLTLPRVLAEARRLRIIVACGLGDAATAERLHRALPPPESEARRSYLADFVARCTR
jgi:tetratricopeptide (TPR) repeat protein